MPKKAATEFHDGDGFQRFIKNATRHEIVNKDEEYRLVRAAQRGEPLAMNGIIRVNVRYLLSMAHRYRAKAAPRGITLSDLFNVGAIGFQKAVHKFECDRDFRLSTYATWWVRHEIARFLEDCGLEIRVPVHAAEKQRKLRAIIEKYKSQMGREPEVAFLTEKTNLTADQIEDLLFSGRVTGSLDKPLGAHEGADLMPLDVYVDAENEEKSPEEAAMLENMIERMLKAKGDVLTRIEQRVLDCRYGKRELTLVETAALLAGPKGTPLSRERIRQIEADALRKLRKAMKDAKAVT